MTTINYVAFTLQSRDERPVEDRYRYARKKGMTVLVVADGITRDLVRGKYPVPSPAAFAAEEVCTTALRVLRDGPPSEEVLDAAFREGNAAIRKLNIDRNPHPDYLVNDFWACVAGAATIHQRQLYWGYITDCGIAVINGGGGLTFRTADDKKEADQYVDFTGKSWDDSAWRLVRRKEHRNNPDFVVNWHRASYGALTGEENALAFVKTGRRRIDPGDIVVVYSDGMEAIINTFRFRTHLAKHGLVGLEQLCREMMPRDKYVEGTLVAQRVGEE